MTLLTEKEVAHRLGASVMTLRTWRRDRRFGPAWLKLGRSVRYRVEDVEAYEARIVERAHQIEEQRSAPRPKPDVIIPRTDERAAEEIIRERLERDGWTVYHRGWPDFFAVHGDGRVKAIEVKGDGDRLTKHQIEMHAALRRAGLNVETIWLNYGPKTVQRTVQEPPSTVEGDNEIQADRE